MNYRVTETIVYTVDADSEQYVADLFAANAPRSGSVAYLGPQGEEITVTCVADLTVEADDV